MDAVVSTRKLRGVPWTASEDAPLKPLQGS